MLYEIGASILSSLGGSVLTYWLTRRRLRVHFTSLSTELSHHADTVVTKAADLKSHVANSYARVSKVATCDTCGRLVARFEECDGKNVCANCVVKRA